MSNQLAHSKSPYLKQHQDNPVHWYEWGDEALELAKKENKIILVSIGYSACHWCHVMAHESFEDEQTAQIMNEHFINIKIDREERPDLDAIFMDACQLVTGQGGWPLNAFALPDGTPFHAGTYFPKDKWQNILLQIAKLWQDKPQQVKKYASDLKTGIEKVSGVIQSNKKENQPELKDAVLSLTDQFDFTFGGMNRAPKFPMPVLWRFVLQAGAHYNLPKIKNQALFTLEQMSLGGIYDWAEGGFARYSVDQKWFAPHFEKMLYDNAQLISLLVEATNYSKDKTFLKIAEECANFAITEWKSENGGFYSAYDADSEGVEGKYYCLTQEEIDKLDLKEQALFETYFQTKKEGNWEKGLNIMYPIKQPKAFAKEQGLDHFPELLSHWKSSIVQLRKSKIKPGLDHKKNTTWNALLLSSFCHLHQYTENPKWKNEATELFKYLRCVATQNNSLFHIVDQKEAYIPAFLEDYAALIQALLDYFETFGSQEAIQWAEKLMQNAIQFFETKNNIFFNMADANHHQLIKEKIEITDNVIPSSNSIMAENLLKLGIISNNSSYFKRAEQMLLIMKEKAISHPTYNANWARLLMVQEKGYPYLISNQKLNPSTKTKVWMVLISLAENQTTPIFKDKVFKPSASIYYCSNQTCHAPVKDLKDLEF